MPLVFTPSHLWEYSFCLVIFSLDIFSESTHYGEALPLGQLAHSDWLEGNMCHLIMFISWTWLIPFDDEKISLDTQRYQALDQCLMPKLFPLLEFILLLEIFSLLWLVLEFLNSPWSLDLALFIIDMLLNLYLSLHFILEQPQVLEVEATRHPWSCHNYSCLWAPSTYMHDPPLYIEFEISSRDWKFFTKKLNYDICQMN